MIDLDGNADPMLQIGLDGVIAGILVCPDVILPEEGPPDVWAPQG